MYSRRRFLENSALLSLSPLVPSFISKSAAASPADSDARILVVIQLDGGNDGLNTVIPFANETYEKQRPTLKIRPQRVLKLNDSIGLHPAMKGCANLYDEGRLTIVQGVGYPNPNRSHFESMAIWHQARLNPQQGVRDGWLGRIANTLPGDESTAPDSIFVGTSAVPESLWGPRANALGLADTNDLRLPAGLTAKSVPASTADDVGAFVSRTVSDSYQAAAQFAETTELTDKDAAYPDSELATQLQTISQLIKFGLGTRIYYVSQPGYDTHSAQEFEHRTLLRTFSAALEAFLNDMRGSGLEDRITVLAFSEFGRRVAENVSEGTDHGAAAPVILAGEQTVGGLLGVHPSLTDLIGGDLKMSVDFRQVYDAILANWLDVDSPPLLGGQPELRLFRQPIA